MDHRLDSSWSQDACIWREVLFLWPNKPVLKICAEDAQIPSHYWDPERLAYDSEKVVFQSVRQIWWLLGRNGRLPDSWEDTIWERTFNASAELQRDAPWRYLLQKVREQLMTAYRPNVDLNLEWRKRLVSVIDDSIMSATLSRRLICGDNFVGLGPADTRGGDEIHILVGGKTPFVLRPRGTNRKSEPKYEILGDCYVQGWMDGDAEEMASLERKTIVLV
jgi:hypothetical protein